jgi:CRP/FNR family transcriptional regulator, cyclic AMP receptor protein
VRVSKFIPNISEEALAVLKEGGCFGEMALIDNFSRSAHAIANTDIEVLAIDKTEMDYVLNMDHEFGYELLWRFTETLSKRLRETNEKMADFNFSIVRTGTEWYSVSTAVIVSA